MFPRTEDLRQIRQSMLDYQCGRNGFENANSWSSKNQLKMRWVDPGWTFHEEDVDAAKRVRAQLLGGTNLRVKQGGEQLRSGSADELWTCWTPIAVAWPGCAAKKSVPLAAFASCWLVYKMDQVAPPQVKDHSWWNWIEWFRTNGTIQGDKTFFIAALLAMRHVNISAHRKKRWTNVEIGLMFALFFAIVLNLSTARSPLWESVVKVPNGGSVSLLFVLYPGLMQGSLVRLLRSSWCVGCHDCCNLSRTLPRNFAEVGPSAFFSYAIYLFV